MIRYGSELALGHDCYLVQRRQEAPPVEPMPAKSHFNGLIFKQSRQGDVLIVSRSLAARMAAPHTLHLDRLKLTDCCLVEGNTLSNAWLAHCFLRVTGLHK